MLIAELHGKRCAAVEGNEDYLTSAVFGHLRNVRDGRFWDAVFERARSVGPIMTTLRAEMQNAGVMLTPTSDVTVWFWRSFEKYGEPDLLLRFSGEQGRPLLLIVEAKLYAGKSGVGPNDQLSRYFDLVHDHSALGMLLDDDPMVALIYLTERYAAADVRESVACSRQPLAGTRMFAMQWQDILEAGREMGADSDSVIGETIRFLEVRGFERFRGFAKQVPNLGVLSGEFYHSEYFRHVIRGAESVKGSFYQ
jgi:hypothetical protein